ncbi:hypothetical protein BBW65_04495 [Helicobacter enhydrae]|uniref:DUF4006 domain-containing protein n=1 Tax=Helicobacter enhydrae TaxID=222136 RepID=A0A1B1U5N1_9HELI|nr:DUF4006 family protein [Helicobacter enhydrae]ANV98104.1 hypothetical protein BBW65_04495 [Helicobacter enhydrae]
MNRMFGINGILGMLILVVVLLSVVAFLGFRAWETQVAQVNNPYRLETPNQIQTESTQNAQYYQLVK